MVESNGTENGAIGRKVSEGLQDFTSDMDFINEDSPYGEKTISLESRPSTVDQEAESVPLPLPLVSARERKWSDTTPYASKKVLLAPNSNFSLWILVMVNYAYDIIA